MDGLIVYSDLGKLSEAVDLTRIDRKLADKIEANLATIDADIKRQGYSDVTVEGTTVRVAKRYVEDWLCPHGVMCDETCNECGRIGILDDARKWHKIAAELEQLNKELDRI